MTPDDNPFASPLADAGTVVADDVEVSDARRMRQKYLKHEASVKSIGTLYYFGFMICLLTGLLIFAGVVRVIAAEGVGAAELSLLIGMCGFFFVIATLDFYVGWGLKRLDSRVRIVTGVLSALGLILFSVGLIAFSISSVVMIAAFIGALINAHFLYLLFSRKGTMVFSDEYREIIRQTPDMRFRTSWFGWVLVVVVVVVAGVLSFALGLGG